MSKSIFVKYGYVWVTLSLFLVAFAGHWTFAWFVYVDDQIAHNQPIQLSSFLITVARDTLENWQSEFLQLIWQVAGLAFLFHVGSPQSKEGDDRKEEKLDAILRAVDIHGDQILKDLDEKYLRK